MSAQLAEPSLIWGIQAEATWKTAFYSPPTTTYYSFTEGPLVPREYVVSRDAIVSTSNKVQADNVLYLKKGRQGVFVFEGQLSKDEVGEVILDRTPFYSEAGGQIGDTGVFEGEKELSPTTTLWQSIKPLMTECSVSHRAISIDEKVLGGIPHVAGTRVSVGQLLGRLYRYDSVDKVVEYYGGRISAEQIKEAIAYAQDFIEAVCEPPESND